VSASDVHHILFCSCINCTSLLHSEQNILKLYFIPPTSFFFSPLLVSFYSSSYNFSSFTVPLSISLSPLSNPFSSSSSSSFSSFSLHHSKSIGNMQRRRTVHSLSLSTSTASRPKYPAYTVSATAPSSPSHSLSTTISQTMGTVDRSRIRLSSVGGRHSPSVSQSLPQSPSRSQSQSLSQSLSQSYAQSHTHTQSQSQSSSRIGTSKGSISVSVSASTSSTLHGTWPGQQGGDSGSEEGKDGKRDKDGEREQEQEALDFTLAGQQGW
jgi:hypothetical protein